MTSLIAPPALPAPAFCEPLPLHGNPRHAGPLGRLRKHLDGEYALARSYWLHYVVGSNLYSVLAERLIALAGDNLAARYASALAILLVLGLYAFWLFLALGVWACAGRHPGRGGSSGWAQAARGALLLGLVMTLMTVPVSVKIVRDHAGMLAGQQPGPATTFRLSGDASILRVHGGINDGTAAELERLLARTPQVTTVVLASGGGWTREGRMMGDVIAARGLNTHVESECSSACTLAFLAGKVRSASKGAHLGFHLFGPGERKASEAAVRKAYGRLDMESGFIDRINETPPTRMWYPDADELVRYRVLTRVQGDTLPALNGAATGT